MSRGEGFGKGHCCDIRESHEPLGGCGKGNGERRGNGGAQGEREEGVLQHSSRDDCKTVRIRDDLAPLWKVYVQV